ncbi:MAG: hypothetical protein KAG53_07630 [Endozoicomonadaceae bacterium]|nr:hypothetical protein [Endozoicomonadaceae bacterium]
METVNFSGKGAFSYVWNKDNINVVIRFVKACSAALIGFCCGYEVKSAEVDSYLSGKGDTCFAKEYKHIHINIRNVTSLSENDEEPETSKNDEAHETSKNDEAPETSKNDEASENDETPKTSKSDETSKTSKSDGAPKIHETDPHSGIYHERGQTLPLTYETKDYDDQKTDEKSMSVEIFTGSESLQLVIIDYQFIKTTTNTKAYQALAYALQLKKLTSCRYDNIESNITEKSKDIMDKFMCLRGPYILQHHYIKDNSKGDKIVLLNASQLNYQEQVKKDHNIKDNIEDVYLDDTFGPTMVREERGGAEFLAHTLIKSDQIQYAGAFFDFFNNYKGENIHASGGYYSSDMDAKAWRALEKKIINSKKKVEGLKWTVGDKHETGTGTGTGKIIYQIGAMNAEGLHRDLHSNLAPSHMVQFLIMFLQIRNALLHETNNNESIVVHITPIGENDVFGNKEHMTCTALQAAIHSLSNAHQSKIKTVFFGNTDPHKHYETYLHLGQPKCKKVFEVPCQPSEL